MAEFGMTIIRLAFSVLSGMFFFFGLDDKDPVCFFLGIILLGGVLIMSAI